MFVCLSVCSLCIPTPLDRMHRNFQERVTTSRGRSTSTFFRKKTNPTDATGNLWNWPIGLQHFRNRGNPIAKVAEGRLSAHLSIYLSIYLCTRRIFVSLFAMHSANVIAVASKLSTLLPPVPMKIELRLKPLSGGRGEGTGWSSPTSVDASVGINLCSGTIAKAAESRLSAHLR